MAPDEALAIVAGRAQQIETISAEAQIVLRGADGRRAVLDGALVTRRPDHLRVRAWKLHTAVLDLTSTPEGVWLMADERMQDAADLPVERLAEAWRLLDGTVLADAQLVQGGGAERGMLAWAAPFGDDGGRVICFVHRATLTPRRYEVHVPRTAPQVPQAVIELDDYRLVDGIPFAHRIDIDAPEGRITLELSGVELNGELPAQAFVPPPRAVRRR